MANTNVFILVLKSTFREVFDWLGLYQYKHDNDQEFYLLLTNSITDNSAVFYFIVTNNDINEDDVNHRSIPVKKLLPGETKLGLVSIESVNRGIKIIGRSEEDFINSIGWRYLISSIEFCFPDLPINDDDLPTKSMRKKSQNIELVAQEESSFQGEIEKNKGKSEIKHSMKDEDGIELVVEINKLKKKCKIDKPLAYDYYAVARWNRGDKIDAILHGIYTVCNREIKAERLINRMSQLRGKYPELKIIKRNENKFPT